MESQGGAGIGWGLKKTDFYSFNIESGYILDKWFCFCCEMYFSHLKQVFIISKAEEGSQL